MGVCENVFRRGAVYWWRCRIGARGEGAKGHVVTVSLCTHDPHSARSLGARLNAEAELVRRALRQGEGRGLDAVRMALMDAARELVRSDRIETREGLVFYVDEAVLHHAEAAHAARRAGRPTGRLTSEIERDILRIVGQDAVASLDRKAAMLRSDLTFDAWGGQDDRFALTIDEDRALAVICRHLALRGSSARIDAEKRAELTGLGFGDAIIDRIAAQLHDHARREQYGSWSIGPTYEQTVGWLSDAGVDPNKPDISRLRRNSLLLLAHILDDVERRYERASPHIAAVYTEILNGDHQQVGARAPARSSGDASKAADRDSADRADFARQPSDPRPPRRPVDDTAEPAIEAGSVPSFLQLTEDLILTKTTGKSQDWTPKTANQHRSIAKLLVKLAGTSDPRRISQTHIGKYFTTLALLPKHYGKSSKDEERSIEEILARAEELEDDEIGLEAGTVNRHQTQLGNILDHMRGNGFSCGDALPSFRRPDSESSDEKRSPFTVAEGQALFALPIYSGCPDEGARLEVGSLVIHDALYWIPLIAWYGLMRLGEIAGLMLINIDLQSKVFIVADNHLRRVKTLQSKRRVPIHPELIRLGFIDYVSELAQLGHEILFPDLKLRGDKTPMGALFYKIFKPALDLALPHAGAQRITLHSTRKTGNTAMIAAEVLDTPRHQIMGHKIPGVNGKHYTAPLPDDVLLKALLRIPVVTQAVRCYPIRLACGLKQADGSPEAASTL